MEQEPPRYNRPFGPITRRQHLRDQNNARLARKRYRQAAAATALTEAERFRDMVIDGGARAASYGARAASYAAKAAFFSSLAAKFTGRAVQNLARSRAAEAAATAARIAELVEAAKIAEAAASGPGGPAVHGALVVGLKKPSEEDVAPPAPTTSEE